MSQPTAVALLTILLVVVGGAHRSYGATVSRRVAGGGVGGGVRPEAGVPVPVVTDPKDFQQQIDKSDVMIADQAHIPQVSDSSSSSSNDDMMIAGQEKATSDTDLATAQTWGFGYTSPSWGWRNKWGYDGYGGGYGAGYSTYPYNNYYGNYYYPSHSYPSYYSTSYGGGYGGSYGGYSGWRNPWGYSKYGGYYW